MTKASRSTGHERREPRLCCKSPLALQGDEFEVYTFNDVNCQATTVPGRQTTCGGGSFLFSVNDLSIDSGQIASITGQITGAQQTTIPAPMTMILFGSGLAGVAAKVRRRRKA